MAVSRRRDAGRGGLDDPSGEDPPAESGAEICSLGDDESFALPAEIFDLGDLGSVLSVEAWNECLSEEDRMALAGFLPDMDMETFGLTLSGLFSGVDDFHFGNPVSAFFADLKAGFFRPPVAARRRRLQLLDRKRHYEFLREYHGSMVGRLVTMRNAWRKYDQGGLRDGVRFGKFLKQWRMGFDDDGYTNGERWPDESRKKKKRKMETKKGLSAAICMENEIHGNGFVGRGKAHRSWSDYIDDDVNGESNKVTVASYGDYPLVKKKKRKLSKIAGDEYPSWHQNHGGENGEDDPLGKTWSKEGARLTTVGGIHHGSKFASFEEFPVREINKSSKSKKFPKYGEQVTGSSKSSSFSDHSKGLSGSSYEAGDSHGGTMTLKPRYDRVKSKEPSGKGEPYFPRGKEKGLPSRECIPFDDSERLEEKRPLSNDKSYPRSVKSSSKGREQRFPVDSRRLRLSKFEFEDNYPDCYKSDEIKLGGKWEGRPDNTYTYNPNESLHTHHRHTKEPNPLKSRQIGNPDGRGSPLNQMDPNPSNSSKEGSEMELVSSPGSGFFLPITPTVHKGFLFSVIHLMSAVRNALITCHGQWDRSRGVCVSMEEGQNGCRPLTILDIVNRVRSNPGDPLLLETLEPLPDLVRGALRILSSKTAPLGAKDWRPLVFCDKINKTWVWIGPTALGSLERDAIGEDTSAEAWGVPYKMLVKLVDAFANWLKSVQETLQQIGSLPPPPTTMFPYLDERERFRDLKSQKNPLTITPSSAEIRAYFHREEALRYSISERAFFYTATDGRKSSVAPLRRGSGKPSSKARDHYLLIPNRPPQVSVHCLVRDAAARLPWSVGTRADISTLLRDSQFVIEGVSDSRVNSVVSGAMERLRHDRDPCVKFDNDRKLWVYLHRDREEEDFVEDGTSSAKKWKRQRKDGADGNHESPPRYDSSPEKGVAGSCSPP